MKKNSIKWEIISIFVIALILNMNIPTFADISINKTQATILVTQKLSLKIVGTSDEVKWTSSNKKVATVNAAGVVTGIKPGTVTITGTVNKKKYNCTVKVKIGINYSKITIKKGESKQLKLMGTKIKSVKTSNKKIATVTKSGIVKGISNGSATITLTGTNNKNYKCAVTVKSSTIQAKSITMDSFKTIRAGEEIKLSVTFNPLNTTDQSLTWKSSNKSVAKVSNGKVTGIAEGTAVITASTVNGKTTKCKVTVTKKKAEVIEAKSIEELISASSDMIKNAPTQGAAGAASGDEYYTGRLIVKTDGTNLSFDSYGAESVIKATNDIYFVQFDSSDDARQASNALSNLPEVIYVEVDEYVTLNEYGISDAGDYNESKSWGVPVIGASAFANSISSNRKEIIVAVVDSGVSKHNFLNGRITSNGFDLVDQDKDPSDLNGHGTHVSGTIVDCTPDLNVKIMPVRVLDAEGSGSCINVGNGITYAVEKGASIINLSLGGGINQYEDECIEKAISKGVTVVVAAGNDNENTVSYSPAHLKNAIVVGAIDSNKRRASFSNYGSAVDLVAPGVGILSCLPGGKYASWNGTSMATPHISALAAMIKLANPSYKPERIEQVLKDTCVDLGSSGRDDYYGCGVPDMTKLIKSPDTKIEPTDIYLSKSNLTLTIGDSANLEATISPSNATNKTVTWSSDDTSVATVNNGTVKAVGTGNTYVRVKTINGYSASCNVQVDKKMINPTGITLSNTSITMNEGGSYQLIATVSPSNATDKTVTWSSDNTSVATISEGKITARKTGSANITGKTINGLAATCKVTVQKGNDGQKIIAKGSCGKDATWSIIETNGSNSDVKLSIDGKGEMYDYSPDNRPPWYEYRIRIRNITMGDSITYIGSYAFSGIDVDDLHIPKSINKLGFFFSPGTKKYSVSEENNCYVAIDGVLYSKDGKKLVFYPRLKGGKSYKILYGTSIINDCAFYGNNYIEEIQLPDTITEISYYAFGSTKLMEITLPSSVRIIRKYAFNKCLNLKNIILNGHVQIIEDGAFDESVNVIEVGKDDQTIIAKGNCGKEAVWSIIKNDGSENDVTLYINGKENMDDYSSANRPPWYEYRERIHSIVIGDNITKIGVYAFTDIIVDELYIPKSIQKLGYYFWPRTKSYRVSEFNNNFVTLDGVIYSNDMKRLISYPMLKGGESYRVIDGTTIINDCAFFNNKIIKNITLPNTITDINNYAFQETNIIEITLPSSVRIIKKDSFTKCYNLKIVILKGPVETIEDEAFGKSVKIIEAYK